MLPLFKLIGLTAAGSVVGELFERVFLKKENVTEAVKTVNWTRVIIASLAIAAAVFFLRNFLNLKKSQQ